MSRGVIPPSAEAFTLSSAARQALLARARDAVVRVVTGGRTDAAAAAPEPDAALARPGAAFVTLHVGGALRGCIGTSEPRRPLWQVVGEMATAAATRDPRFAPLGPGDLDDLTVEISVLSPDRTIRDPEEIEIGRHGIDVRRRLARGLLLPQVAVEHGLDRERFLAETCRKAGLPGDAWRDPATEIRIFEAHVFGDEDDRGVTPPREP
jgi:AmmeMemoRadiSam system protein A